MMAIGVCSNGIHSPHNPDFAPWEGGGRSHVTIYDRRISMYTEERVGTRLSISLAQAS